MPLLFLPFHTALVHIGSNSSAVLLLLEDTRVELIGHIQPSSSSHLLASVWAITQPLVLGLLLVVCTGSFAVPESTFSLTLLSILLFRGEEGFFFF